MITLKCDDYTVHMDERGDLPPEGMMEALRYGIFGHDSEMYRCGLSAKKSYDKKNNLTLLQMENEENEFEVQLLHPKKVTLKDFLHQRFQ